MKKKLTKNKWITSTENRRKIPVLCVDGVAAAAWGIGVDRSFLPEPSGEGIYYIIMRES